MLTYAWQQVAGRSIEIPWPNAGFLHFQIPADAEAEDYEFQLTVTDPHGLSDTVSRILTVYANAAPVPLVSGPVTETSGRYIEIDAGNSYDVNGHYIQFLWEQIGGQEIEIEWPASSKLAFHTPVVFEDQLLTFRVTLTDDFGASSQYTHEITIRRSYEPVIIVPQSFTVSAGEYITMDASESHDPDGDDVTFNWQQTGGHPVQLAWPDSAVQSFQTPVLAEASTLTFNLTVTDAVGFSSEREITVNVAANQVPVVDFNVPNTMDSGTSSYINAWGSYDPEGSSLSFNWRYVSGPWVELKEPESGGFMFTAPEMDETTDLVLLLTVTDKYGAKTETQITIQIVANLPPQVVTTAEITASAGEFLVLDASTSSDPEGEDIWFYWQQMSGESPAQKWGEWTDKLNVQLADNQTGELSFQATVTDASGNSASSLVTVTVQE